MQEMAHITSIKSVIENLCLLLAASGASKINPEIFRQAKFDKDEATKHMWRLNYEVLNLMLDDRNAVSDCLSDESLVITVKTAFFHLHYQCNEFYNLPLSMSSGSRELLIAFGWMLAKYDLMSNLLCLIDTSIFDCLFNLPCSSSGLTEELIEKDTIKELERILFLQRKNKQDMKITKQMYSYLTKMLLRINTNDKCSIQNLKEQNLLHFLILNARKGKLNMLLSLLENEQDLIKYFIKWFQNEHLFWKWLSSVTEEKKKNLVLNENCFHKELNGEAARRMIARGTADLRSFEGIENFSEHLHKDYSSGLSDEILCKTKVIMKCWEFQGPYRELRFLLEKLCTSSFAFLDRRQCGDSHKNHYSSCTVQDLHKKLVELRNKNEKYASKESFDSITNNLLDDVIHLPMPRR